MMKNLGKILAKRLVLLFLLASLFLGLTTPVWANETAVLGVHVLTPTEAAQAKEMLKSEENHDQWHYLTIPLSLDDLNKKAEWQEFFKLAKEQKIIPIVRLVTKFENGAWQRPNRKQITDSIGFLTDLDWPTDKKHIIVFNEVNHAPEWGGQVDPASYLEVLKFTSNWAHSEGQNFVVLPAAMDLAAPNGGTTREAFSYLSQMYQLDPEVFNYIDAWNSHSYPNPGFSSAPTRTAKNSLRGFEHELAWLKQKTGRDYQVFITETGWVANRQTTPWLESYYTYALQHIWSHPQVVAVTPFLFKGAPGPFVAFSFVDRNDQPTVHYQALQQALAKSVQ